MAKWKYPYKTKPYEHQRQALKESIERHLNELLTFTRDELLEQRYSKFRALGKFIESGNIEEIYSEVPTESD